MRSEAKLVVVLLAVISVEWVQAKPYRSQCNDCENNLRGNQIGVITDQHDVAAEGDEITGIKVNQEDVTLKGGSHGDEIVGAKINQRDVHIHGGSGKTIGIDLNQKDITIAGDGNNASGLEEIRGSDESDGSDGSDGSDRCGTHGSRGANGCSRPSGTNTNRGPTNTQQGSIPSDTTGVTDGRRFRSPNPPKIQLPLCADSPLIYCGMFDGTPVYARDCNNPYQRCLPSHTMPTGSRNSRFPSGGNGPMRQPNRNGGPAPGQRFNGDYTGGSENGWDSTSTNDGSFRTERHPSDT